MGCIGKSPGIGDVADGSRSEIGILDIRLAAHQPRLLQPAAECRFVLIEQGMKRADGYAGGARDALWCDLRIAQLTKGNIFYTGQGRHAACRAGSDHLRGKLRDGRDEQIAEMFL